MREYWAAYRKRMKRVSATFEKEEYETVKEAAKRAGKPLALYVKEAALASGDAVPEMPREAAERLDEFVRQIRGVATNVNQMAHRSNALREAVESGEVMLRLKFLEERVKAFLSSKPEGGT